jgi:multiple sugar transport system substrate-binding protein
MQKLQAGIYIGTVVIVLIIALILFGVIPGLNSSSSNVTFTFWGPYSPALFANVISEYQKANRSIQIKYFQKDFATYEQDLVNAFAIGQAPDMWIVLDSWINKHNNKIAPGPQTIMTARDYESTLVDAAVDSFLFNQTVYAVPLGIDPLVLYWNRDLFANETLTLPPKTWDEFVTYSTRLTKREANGNLIRSGNAMGLASNIPEFNHILSLLILQGGTSIVDPKTFNVTLGEIQSTSVGSYNPSLNALQFYLSFSDRQKSTYSWNSTFPDPVTAFEREDLAMFIGFASNLQIMKLANPRLPVSVAPVPQFANAPFAINYARTLGYTVSKTSIHQTEAWTFIKYLASASPAAQVAYNLNIAPARRDLLQAGTADADGTVIYRSAIQSKVWYKPDETQTLQVFRTLIESALGGRELLSALNEATQRLRVLLNKE